MNRATMLQLVDALNKAGASGDKESMFRGVDELDRYSWMFSKISMRLGFQDLPSFKRIN